MELGFRASGWVQCLRWRLAVRRGRLRGRPRDRGRDRDEVHASLKMADPSEGPSKTGFAPIVKEVLPNVVNISSSKVVRTPNQMPEGMQSDPFLSTVFWAGFGNRQEIPKTSA